MPSQNLNKEGRPIKAWTDDMAAKLRRLAELEEQVKALAAAGGAGAGGGAGAEAVAEAAALRAQVCSCAPAAHAAGPCLPPALAASAGEGGPDPPAACRPPPAHRRWPRLRRT